MNGRGRLRRRIRAMLGRLVYWSGLYRAFFRRKGIIVVFHRVDDRFAGDPITCTEREFRSFAAFFRRFFEVVPLGVLLEKIRRGESVARHLAITFDDGYRDNLTIAAPILQTHRLPACFFIATGFIGSDRVAPWDAAQGRGSTWMSWDDVRRLRELGFEIGAHTVNHPDLGKLDGATAEVEIGESRRRLEVETGGPVQFFSYPFGRRENITEATRGRVRQAGLACCVSAFGGTVKPGLDPHRLPRTAVSPWFLSPYQFGYEVLRVPAVAD